MAVVPARFRIGGCANVPGDAGFRDVEKAVVDRTGQHVRWNHGTSADQ
jgi:hypothetical protein